MDKSAIYFEENYIFRNNRSITSNNDIALTEFVANAWDAGAHNVSITIPYEEHEEIIVEDDGTGMTDDEFHSRWMTLNYDRQKRSRFRLMLMEPKESHMGVMALVDMVCCALQTVTLLKHGKIMFVIFTILVFPTGMLRLKSKSIQ